MTLYPVICSILSGRTGSLTRPFNDKEEYNYIKSIKAVISGLIKYVYILSIIGRTWDLIGKGASLYENTGDMVIPYIVADLW